MAQFGTGRHHKRYYYTTQDIAQITKRAEGTIRNDTAKNKLDMADLKSIAEYIRAYGS